MPIMDGFETTKILVNKMKEGRMRKIPIIAVTANKVKNVEEYYDKGFSQVIEKPITEILLKEALKKDNLYWE